MKDQKGNWKKDLGTDRVGFEYALAVGKTYEKWAYHINFGGGYTNNGREEGETGKVDELELEYGAALVYMPFKALSLILEYKSEFEKEATQHDGDNYGTEIYVVPGISVRVGELRKNCSLENQRFMIIDWPTFNRNNG